MNLTPKLVEIKNEIEIYAREFGLDFFEIIFEILDYEQLNEVAAYSGFPTRYPHWSFGMEYQYLEKAYSYGLQKIYELVINTNPSYAYLLECNNIVDQKIVMAHVYGHCDFFKNNYYYSKTNRNMMNEIANHGATIRKYVDKYGYNEIEKFLDICLSIDDLIDLHLPFIVRSKPIEHSILDEEINPEDKSNKFKSKKYMDSYINPKEILEKQKKDQEEQEKKLKEKFPSEVQKDILLFLLEHAPLNKWQSDILSIIREEAYYFAPQRQTKILNEGWASYLHSSIMTQKALHDEEIIDYADHHSGTLATSPGRLNPYKLGIELFKDIRDRWDKGKFGKEYDECENLIEKRNWNKNLNLGTNKIFEVRKHHNDITFIDEFLTPEFCVDQKLFTYEYNSENNMYEIADREFKKVKNKILFSLTNFGRPYIFIENGNYNNRGELLLVHRHEGIDLHLNYACDVLKNIYHMWKKPIYISTKLEDKSAIISFDGEKHSVEK